MKTALERIESLPAEKQLLLAAKLEPASYGQQRLWFIDRLQPADPSYHIFTAVRLLGDLDVAALQSAFTQVITRHGVLRTSLPWVGDRLIQLVHPPGAFRLDVADLRELTAQAQEQELAKALRDEFELPFDLRNGPLLRARLYRTGDAEHVIAMTLHHAIFDGWSRQILLMELAACYEAARADTDPQLQPMRLQYTDFARWQRKWLTGSVLDRQIDFWRDELADVPPALPLVYDRPRWAAEKPVGQHIAIRIPDELSRQIRELCRSLEATPFMFLLAAFNVLLQKYTGSDDIVVGTPIAGRSRPEFENLIGFFVNTLVLRNRLADNASFVDLLKQVRASALRAFGHQDVPFEKLVDALQPDREIGVSPLFQVMFSLQNTPMNGDSNFADLEIGPLSFAPTAAQFDLALNLMDAEDTIAGTFEFNRSLFDESSIRRMSQHFLRLLECVVRQPQQALHSIDLSEADEQRRLLVDWNATDRAYDERFSIGELFARQVQQSPDKIAAVDGESEITYRQLDERANRLAAYLLEHGVQVEQRVGVCLPRSIDFIVSVLAVLKAGGTYVPLDPSYPQRRLEYMIDDAAMRLIVTTEALARSLPETDAALICLDRDSAEIDSQPAGPVSVAVSPDNLCYVMYTSGSTGKPKGVAIPHRGVGRLVFSNCARFGSDEVILFFAPVSFDASTFELWGALLHGARVAVYAGERASVQELGDAIERFGVTAAWLTAGLFHVLMDESPEALAGLSQLLAGGAVLSPDHVRRALERHPQLRLINGYGPTESTTFTTCHPIGLSDLDNGDVPLGKPISNTQVYVLDERMQPVPLGVAGELYIGGAGLARGYLDRAALTAQGFVPNPFGDTPGSRLYRSGDRVRYRSDGSLQFLGRVDEQLKLRGYRIEPGEIEAQLCAHGAVREAVVMLRSDAGAEARLVGYAAVGEGAQEPGLGEQLREWLAQRLPQYMVPASLVVLESLPLTANGKADRAALPAPQLERAPVSAPHTPTEIALAQLYEQLLGVEGVGREDGFFALGGHSLLATQLISRVAERFTVQLELRSVFETPQLQALAARIDEAQHSELAPIPLADRSQALPLSHAQERLWFLDRLDAAAGAAYHIPVGLRLSGELDVPALRAALDRLVYRHESLRTHFVEVEGRPRQQIGPAQAGFGLQEHDLSGLDEAARTAALQHQIAEQAQARFDLGAGPLMRGCLLRLDAAEHVLLLTQHHIVSDGWSMGVLVEEVAQLYRAYSEGGDDPLAPLSIQYADYAAWQRDSLSGAALEEQIGYWREQLSGAPALLELPTDRARPPVQGYAGDSVGLEIAPALAERLQQLSQRHGVTLFMTLLAGWSLLLSRLSGQPEVVVGTPVANRGRRELEPLIGFFVNTLALRVSLDDAPSVSQLLSQIRATTLGGYAHQDLPFEQVVEALQPARHLNHSPLFQTMLSLNNTPQMDRLPLSGLTLSALDTQLTTTQFDLSLSLSAADDGRLLGTLLYARDLFDRETVERWGGYLQRLLAAMVEDDTRCATTLGLLSETQREQVVERFNASAREVVTDTSLLHQGFERQAALRPQAVALRYGDESLSYGQLNRQANRIAARLIDAGVGPDARVGLCLQRGPQLIAAMLGILKAGGAYVPLDPQAPPARLQHLLGDAEPVALVTDTALAARLDALSVSEAALVCVDQLGDHSDPGDEDNPVVTGLGGDRLAYLIYTSGSTGQPKGVMVEHRNIANLIGHWCARFGGQVEEGRFNGSFWTQFGFDVSVFEIFVTLTLGGALDIVADEVRPDPEALLRWLRERDTQLSYLPPFFVRHLERVADADIAALALRSVLVGVEPFEEAQLHRLERLIPGLKIVNAYGPTETTVFSLANDALGDRARRAPLGRPVANTGIYILDARAQPVPIGVIGEIYIGGAGVARGYFNRRALTAQRFVANPFAAGEGERLYRSGDLGRWLPDGQVEFCGRCDFQLKLRGYRIEPGEIEAQLCAHGAVREAVVMLRSDAGAEARLVGYAAVGESAQEPGLGEQLREWLAQRLPQYMVPASLVVLESLPLTANGKADRAALPAPQLERAPVSAPHTPTEIALAQLYEQLLGVEGVGREDGFFALGGHSLLATQLISRVAERFTVQLELRSVFETPQLQALAARIDEAQHSELAPIPLADRSQALPLSHAQERLWFLDRLDAAAGAAYHIPVGLRLSGELDVPALRAALDRLVYRHESLRTHFVEVEGRPRQQIGPAQAGFGLQEHDLSGLDEAARTAALQHQIAEQAQARFDLGAGPLMRGCLLRLDAAEHVLLLTQHHIVSDGWSMGVLVEEVAQLYRSYSEGGDDPLAPLSIQYADYAAWQRDSLSGAALEEQIGYWREQLSGAPALLELPTDRARPPVQGYAGDSVGLEIAPALAERLQQLSQRHGVTLFMTLLAGWSLLLSRLSGQPEVVVGTPVANRGRRELEPLIGFFVNTLALRVSLDDAPSVSQLLSQIRATTLGGYAHQDLPFEQVVEALQPARHLNHSPLFQTMLSLNNTPQMDRLPLSGLTLSALDTQLTTTQFDLSLSLSAADDGRLLGTLLYARDLFDRETVERWGGYLQRLLAAMVEDDTRCATTLGLLSETQREQVVERFNASAREVVTDTSLLHQGFERQAALRPQAVALRYGDESLSYGQLNRQANRIAARLIDAGVGPDARVGLCLQRGPQLIAAMLGILKAGGAYVPLDPQAPPARLQHLLGDAEPVALVTDTALAARLDALSVSEAALVCVDQLGDHSDPGDDGDEDNPVVTGLGGDRLAYLIYTSGSTGQPKGVMVEHRNATRLFAATQPEFGFGADDVWTNFHSAAFDFSVWEIFGALSTGGCLVLVPHEHTLNPELFYELLCREGVTVLNQTPSAFRQLIVASAESQSRHSLRHIVFGGEALEPASLIPWIEKNPISATALINMYGITETTVHTTFLALTEDQVRSGVSNVGRPLADLAIYILDENLTPVPPGVVGEIYVGGAGVARGYFKRRALTAQRFVANPFASGEGERLYRSGDLGRWLPDGSIEYRGRNDFQVKLRGFRIELGEIEAQLAAHPAVTESGVVMQPDTTGTPQLIAYLAVSDPDDEQISVGALRDWLSQRLPAYMVPGAFVVMDSLPLNHNGKLDRRALPRPDLTKQLADIYEPPETETEAQLCEIWRRVLGVERVGVKDNYFALGGDSIRSVQIVHLAIRAGLPTSVMQLFQTQTVREMARSIAQSPVSALQAVPAALPPTTLSGRIAELVPDDAVDVYPMSAMQQLMVQQTRANSASGEGVYHAQQSFHVRDRSPSYDSFVEALQRVIAANPILNTTLVMPDDNDGVQAIRPAIPVTVERRDIRDLSPRQQQRYVDELLLSDRQQVFDVDSADALYRFYWLDRSEDSFEFTMSIHHAIDDGWGNVVFLNQLLDLYTALKNGVAKSLPVAANVYREFIALEHRAAASDGSKAFWQAQTLPHTATASLAEPSADEGANGPRFEVPAALGLRLRSLARELQVSVKALYLDAYLRLIERHTDQPRNTVGVVMNGRSPQLSDPFSALGLFWNMLPFAEQHRHTDIEARVRHVHEQLVAMELHASTPLPAISDDEDLFFATFNFTDFHHAAGVGSGSGELEIVAIQAFDKFHYPLNLAVSKRQGDESALVAIEYRPHCFSRAQAQAFGADFLLLVAELADLLQGRPAVPDFSLNSDASAERQDNGSD